MKKIREQIVLATIIIMIASSAWALGDNNNHNTNNNDIHNSSEIRSTNTSINDIDNKNTNMNSNHNYQGQAQKQGQGQVQSAISGGNKLSQGNDQNTNIEGDTQKNTVYANAWPGISGESGTSNFNGYSIFGGVGISSTSAYKVCIEKLANIKMMETCEYMTKDEALTEARAAWKQFKYTTQDKRFLGVLWKTTDRNLLNGFGLLAWDPFWADNESKESVNTK